MTVRRVATTWPSKRAGRLCSCRRTTCLTHGGRRRTCSARTAAAGTTRSPRWTQAVQTTIQLCGGRLLGVLFRRRRAHGRRPPRADSATTPLPPPPRRGHAGAPLGTCLIHQVPSPLRVRRRWRRVAVVGPLRRRAQPQAPPPPPPARRPTMVAYRPPCLAPTPGASLLTLKRCAHPPRALQKFRPYRTPTRPRRRPSRPRGRVFRIGAYSTAGP
jgi:hypothetical protein